MSGTVIETGEGVTGYAPGDRVVVESVVYDDSCYACRQHAPGLCHQRVFVGYTGYGGGFAHYICAQPKSIHKLPDSISMEVGALIEPLAVAWHGVKVSQIKQGQSALIIGGGESPLTLELPEAS